LLAFEFHLVETRADEHIGQQIEGLRERRVYDFEGKARHLMRSISIEVAAEAVAFDGDVEDGAAARAFENSVFDEMADAVEFRRFVARTAPDPDADSGRAKAGHVLGDDGCAAGKSG
jgi:phage repressor protein C with HTH and peptisase S24 domain